MSAHQHQEHLLGRHRAKPLRSCADCRAEVARQTPEFTTPTGFRLDDDLARVESGTTGTEQPSLL